MVLCKRPSHVSFFHLSTFNFIARKMGSRLLFSNEKNVIIFQKETRNQSQSKVSEAEVLNYAN